MKLSKLILAASLCTFGMSMTACDKKDEAKKEDKKDGEEAAEKAGENKEEAKE